jgi:membrane protein YqaA with SNARE-associated domain
MAPVDPASAALMLGSAFLAGSVLPAQSEAVLVALLLAGGSLPWLVALATVGNVGGACLNYWLGRGIERFRDHRLFPVSPARWDQAMAWYTRFGPACLLLSWLPLVGDGLTVAAGAAGMGAARFLALVTLAKGGRYLVLALALPAP